jgi:hypothetical protein
MEKLRRIKLSQANPQESEEKASDLGSDNILDSDSFLIDKLNK